MNPDQFPGIRLAALVVVRNHAVDKETGALPQAIELFVVHEDAAAGEYQHHQEGFQVLPACHMTFLQLQIASLLHIEKGGAGKGSGGLDHPAGAGHIGVRELVKIVFHGLYFLSESMFLPWSGTGAKQAG